MKKQQSRYKVITMSAIAVFGVGLVLSIVGLSVTMQDIDGTIASQPPEAVLASAGVESGGSISLPVAYFDQKADGCVNMYDKHASKALATRQFEWTSCGYNHKEIERGLVEYELGEDYLPVAVEGKLNPNLGIDMKRWFTTVEGKSKEYTGALNLNYQMKDTVEFSYTDNDFYPLDKADFSASDEVNIDGHNHLWTMSFAVPFRVIADGSEMFELTADDDTFIFIGNELAVDMGGIHGATAGRIAINEGGEVYTAVADEELAYSGIQVAEGDNSVIRIFHADRDSDGSVFRIKIVGMNLNVIETQLAGTDGVQVAYDPTNPSYVAPLGETTASMPNVTKGHVIMATILGVVVVVCAMFVAMLAHSVVKSRK